MIGFLRFVGVANAAMWFGASIFFTFSVGPAFFSDKMIGLLTRPYAGAAAQIVIERYFLFHELCGAVALVHLVAEWLYMGKPLQRLTLWLLLGILALGLVGGHILLAVIFFLMGLNGLIGWALSGSAAGAVVGGISGLIAIAFTVGFLYPLKLLVSFLQAFIFVMLTMLYIAGAIEHAEDAHGAEHHDSGHH